MNVVQRENSGLAAKMFTFVFDNSLLLIAGAAAGIIWSNAAHDNYLHFTHASLLVNQYIGTLKDGYRVIDVHFLVNDILMAVFFAMAGREVWSALLPGGALSSPRRAAVPVACAVGGMIGPAAIYLAGAAVFGRLGELGSGWAIPCATDIAFSYMVARALFGDRHPAIPFLLLLAIVDDALDLLVLTLFFPQEAVQPAWLAMSLAGVGVGVTFWFLHVRSFWWYLLIPGTMSWMGFAFAGLHPALGLLPIVPTIPHVHLRQWHVGWDFVRKGDAHQFEYYLKRPVEIILGLFGLLNAGVLLIWPGSEQLTVTLLVLGGLVIGKPLSICLTAGICTRVFKLQLGKGLTGQDMVVLGCAAGIGFTVSLFVATVAFPEGPVQDAAKMGALLSFLAAGAAWLMARLVVIRKYPAVHPPQDRGGVDEMVETVVPAVAPCDADGGRSE